jgi:hypothetical protein
MNRLVILTVIAIIMASAAPHSVYAQTPAPNTTAPVTGIKPDRTTADPAARQAMQKKEAALKQKRAECRKEAKKQKLSVLKRRKFVHECMSR